MSYVTARNVSVRYPVFTSASRSLKNRILSRTTGGRIAAGETRHVEIQALDDVNFTFETGERIALIGHNGSGKSTLLRTIAGIYHPSSGTLETRGKIATLFDATFGMDFDATGYENIMLRRIMLGISREEMAGKIEAIAEFTELGEFLDMPMRTYSSGMVARLAFAVATSVDADILLLDEAVGAGDAAFVNKANARIAAFIDRSPIMVLASHSDELLKRFCTRGLVMKQGQVTFDGPIEDALDHYETIIGAVA